MASLVSFRKLSERAIVPRRATGGAAGYDVYCLEKVDLPPLGIRVLRTGIAPTFIRTGTYLQLVPRSSCVVNKSLTCLGGTIDSDFRGEIMVILMNLSPSHETTVQEGERVCQMLVQHHLTPANLDTVYPHDFRGNRGIGSTGVNKYRKWSSSRRRGPQPEKAPSTSDQGEDWEKGVSENDVDREARGAAPPAPVAPEDWDEELKQEEEKKKFVTRDWEKFWY